MSLAIILWLVTAAHAADGDTDGCDAVSNYVDVDGDGFGDVVIAPLVRCPWEPIPPLPPGGGTYVEQGGDCDDVDPSVHPGHVEWCDGHDNDCNGWIDDGIPTRLHYIDRDGDGFGDPNPAWAISVQCPPAGYSPFPTDCRDDDASIHPLVDELARTHLPLADAPLETNEADRDPAFVADGIDQDCNLVDLCYLDADRDGFGTTELVIDNDLNCRNLSAFTSSNDLDCDDTDPYSSPLGEEVPGDAVDQDCDGVDVCFVDRDLDGWGTSEQVLADDLDCDDGSQATASRAGDCRDEGVLAAGAHPGAREVCNGVDDNCDGRVDDLAGKELVAWYLDADHDGWGDDAEALVGCGAPLGYTLQGGDCDDADADVFPGQVEECNGVDDDCEDGIDEGCDTDDGDDTDDTDDTAPPVKLRRGCHAWGGAYACLAVMPLSWLRRRRR